MRHPVSFHLRRAERRPFVQEYANCSGPDLQLGTMIGGGQAEGSKTGSNPTGGTVPNARQSKCDRLPKELEEQLAQMLKVLSMIPVVLESR